MAGDQLSEHVLGHFGCFRLLLQHFFALFICVIEIKSLDINTIATSLKLHRLTDKWLNSKSSCQREDWPSHKQICGQTKGPHENHMVVTEQSNVHRRGDSKIFDEDEKDSSVYQIHPPLVDFSKAVPKKDPTSGKSNTRKQYLYKNEFHHDIPEVDDPEQSFEVNVKCNKEKQKLTIQKTWSGTDFFKFLSYSLSIPLENVKLIHKGKVLTPETVMETVKPKAVYQVIGEPAEAEDDIDQRDISVMMAQCGLDRKKAIQKLRKKGDLLDALLDQ